MASLTPGVLLKLLENVGNKEAKVNGEHRSALLQVIEILPSLGDDILQSRGFFLKVSDSLHCAYVSMSEEDFDLIYSDKIQLGQFVYVGWLGSGSPLPVLRGLKPVPRRRAGAGNSKDMVCSDLVLLNGNVGFLKEGKGLKNVKPEGKETRKERDLVRREKVRVPEMEPRRLSLDSARRVWDQKSLTARNSCGRAKSKISSGSSDLASIPMGRKSSPRDGTSLKSTTSVISPSKSKNRISSPKLTGKPPAEDLKFSSKGSAVDNLRKQKGFVSPRLSCKLPEQDLKLSSKPSAADNLSRKSSIVSPRLSFKLPEPDLKLSSKASSVDTLRNKKGTSSLRLSIKPSEQDSQVSSKSSDPGSLKNKNGIISPKLSKPLEKDLELPYKASFPAHLTKMPLSFRAWSDQRISWDTLPRTVHDLGKEAVYNRNAAFLAAVQALEEASAGELVVHCMREFSELCESSWRISTPSLLEQFLDLHHKMQRAAKAVTSLIDSRQLHAELNSCSSPKDWLSDAFKSVINKNAISWTLAAIGSDLSGFNLYRKEDEADFQNGKKHHYVVIEKTPNELSSEAHLPREKQVSANRKSFSVESSAKRVSSQPRQHSPVVKKSIEKGWSIGAGLKEAACLAEKLLLVSREWFLKYLDDSLKVGFGSIHNDSTEFAGLVRQLKIVNQWLDNLVQQEGDVDVKIEDLKKKIYTLYLERVNSAFTAK